MRRTQLYRVMPWVGGINTSVDPGVLNSQELVQADNVQFSSTGARIKREALEYLDHAIEAPDFRSSSGTTRTLKWTTHPLVDIAVPDQRLVVGEHITVTGNANYNTDDAVVDSITAVVELTSVTCVADTAGSLAGKYFLFSAGDSGVDYYAWFKVSGTGTDPGISNRTGVEVDISTGANANAVATAVAGAINPLADFGASASTDTVSIVPVIGGFTRDAGAGTSGFTLTVTVQGGHFITYTAATTLSESSTAAAGVLVARASAVISYTDWWHFDGAQNTQIGIFATDDFQLFSLDNSGRRVQIFGQEQVSDVLVTGSSSLTTGDHFLLNGAGNVTNYYVWYNKAGGGGNPLIGGRTGIEVAVGASDAASVVATLTAAAVDATPAFSAVVVTSTTVRITAATTGATDETLDSNTGFTFSTHFYGATAPLTRVDTIRTNRFNERLQIYFSGLGNFPIIYSPEISPKYQMMAANLTAGLAMPDASFAFNFLGRVWTNDKNNPDYLHYCETFDETLWLGFGDSGALPVNPGDGDPEGITNAYAYKEFPIVAKKDVRYRVMGDSPENFQVQKISDGMGNEGPFAVPVDETDVLFISKRGIHSQQVTDQYGDVSAAYLSSDIKPTFNTFESAELKRSQGAYIPELNSVAISVAEQGQTRQGSVWLYNIGAQVPNKQKPGAWYRWPGISCTALSRRFVSDKHKLVFGTANGRIIQAQKENSFADFGTDGILYKIKTGAIYPGEDPQTMKAFKRITMIYRPKGNFSFAVNAKIDNHQSQGFAFNEISGLDLLGETFILGTSLLGSANVLAPFTFTMEGYGRGVTLTITQPSPDEQIEVWGLILEWEDVKLEQEVQ